MKIYVPFFITSICCCLLVYILYNPSYDYEIKSNIYGYSSDSYDSIISNELVVDRYYHYIDCYVSSKKFVLENMDIYKEINDCEIDILKVNALSNFYENSDVLKLLELEFDYLLINEANYEKVLEFVLAENFISNNLERYLNYEGEKVILNVNINHDLKGYKDFNTVYSIDEKTVVNKFNMLSEFNNNLSYCMGYYIFSEDMCNDFKKFLQELRDTNISYNIINTFKRDDLFDEHATGLAIDIEYDYTFNNLVEEIASRHGFILRFKTEYFNVCGYEEDGHFRYVDSISEEIYMLQISLEEYVYLNG